MDALHFYFIAMMARRPSLIVVAGYLLGIPALLGTFGALHGSLTESLQVKLNFRYMLGGCVVMDTYELAKLMLRKKVARIPMSEALKEIVFISCCCRSQHGSVD